MKTFVFILFMFCFFIACDPYQLVYIKNYTNSEVSLNVQFQKQAGDSKNLQKQIADTLIEKPKMLLTQKFDQKIVPEQTSDTTYFVNLPSESFCLLSPVTIGFPINKVQLSGKSGMDSIIFYRLNSNIKEQIKKGKLKKVNWAFFIYDYKP